MSGKPIKTRDRGTLGFICPASCQSRFLLMTNSYLSSNNRDEVILSPLELIASFSEFFNRNPNTMLVTGIIYFSFCAQLLSHVWLFAIPWTVAHQAPLSMGFSRQEHWSGLSFPSPEDLPDPWIKPTSPVSPALQADSLPAEPLGKPKDPTCLPA